MGRSRVGGLNSSAVSSSSRLDVEMKDGTGSFDRTSVTADITTANTGTNTGKPNEVDYMIVSLDADTSFEYEDWDSDSDSDCDLDFMEVEQGGGERFGFGFGFEEGLGSGIRPREGRLGLGGEGPGGPGEEQVSFPHESVLDIPPIIGSTFVSTTTERTEWGMKNNRCCDSLCSGSEAISIPLVSSSSSPLPPSSTSSSLLPSPSSASPSPSFSSSYHHPPPPLPPPTIELIEGATAPINPALALFPLPKISSIPAYPLRDGYPDLVMRGTPGRVAGWARGRLGRG